MPRKQASNESSEEDPQDLSQAKIYKDYEVDHLNRMLAAVLESSRCDQKSKKEFSDKFLLSFYKKRQKKYDKNSMIEKRVQSIGLLEYLLNSMMEICNSC